MQAEIITIGDEILIGQIVDTNSAWLGEKLNAAGIRIHRITSVSDTARHIEQAVGEALKRSDVVICTGGLGPTKDDITKHTLARMFGMALVRDEAVYEQVRRMTELRHIDFNELNQAQALVPEGCVVLPNRCGTAPGMWFERDGRVLVSLPGVPFEMKTLVDEQVLPRLCEHFRFRAIVHRTAITFGMAESILAETIAGWESALPGYLHLAYLPSALCIRLRLSAYEIDREEAERELGRQFERLERIIPYGIVGYGDVSLESVTGDLLRARGATVATAESCTGGNIARRFTALPGASDYFRGGVSAFPLRSVFSFRRYRTVKNTKSFLKLKKLFVIRRRFGYFLAAKKSFTCSLGTTSVLKAYAPVLSDFTILIHFVNALPVPVFSVATTFFAMVQAYLISR